MAIKRIKDTTLYPKNIDNALEYKWTRPTDWLTLPTVGSSDQKTVGLVAIYDNESNYIAFTATGNFTVDWGDGTSPVNYTSGATAQYKYDYATISAGTLSSEGYKQVIVTITPQAGQTLQTLDFQKFHSECVTGQNQSWLELIIGITSTFQLSNYSTNVAYFPVLRQLSINNHGSTLGTTMLRGNAQQVSKVFVNKALQIAQSGPFQYSTNLEEIYINPACTAADLSNLFLNCYKLKYAPFFDTSGATTMVNMFQNCYELEYVPLYNTANVTSMASMFSGCYALKKVPLFNTVSVTAMNSMFSTCYNLSDVPLFNTANVTTMATMFQACYSLQKVPFFNTIKLQTLDTMFQNCYTLQSIPPFNLVASVSASNMFQNCYNLKSVPDIFVNSLAGISGIFNSCTSMTKTPPILFVNAVACATSPFSLSITEVDRFNISSLTAAPAIAGKFRRCQIYGGKYTLSYANHQMGRTSLNEVIDNLGVAATTQTLTITGNPGATLWPVLSRSSTTTSGSTTITLADTSSFVTGMQVTGTGISDTRSVTFTDAGDLVTLAAHGLSNGKRVSFTTITSTTGIAVYTTYYVINAATDTFQLSLTNGGSAIALTTDGSGTMLHQTLVTNIVANTSVTIDVPASASGTNTLAYRNINTQIAIMKRWSVTG